MLPKADSGGFVLLLFILTITDPSRTGKGVTLMNAFGETGFAAVRLAALLTLDHDDQAWSCRGRQGL